MSSLKLSGVHGILHNTSLIDNQTYIRLLNELPSGLVTKLRLVPDSKLPAKLAHLYTVCNIEACVENLGFPYKCLSVEGISGANYYFDHDAVVLNQLNQTVVIVDCTSDTKLIESKTTKLIEIKLAHPVLQSHYVYLYNKKSFTVNINLPKELTGSAEEVFKMFDNISLRSSEWQTKFLNTCGSIYEEVSNYASVMARPELDNKYEKWFYAGAVVDKSIKLVTEHSDQDIDDFKFIAERTPTSVFYKTLEKILMNQRSITAPLFNKPAMLNTSKNLKDVLLSLSANPIAKCLHNAMLYPKQWVGVDSSGNVLLNVNIKSVHHDHIVIGDLSNFLVLARQNKEHIFSIKLSHSIMDDNFFEQLTGAKKYEKPKRTFNKDPVECFKEINIEHNKIINELSDSGGARAANTILGKIATLGNLYNNETPAVSAKCTGVVTNIVEILQSRCYGDIVNHDYEVAKTFAASLKQSPGNDQFYVGVNGPFQSVTIIKMNCTQDSFTTAAYFVLYQQVTSKDFVSVKAYHTVESNIVQGKTRSFNKNSLTHALKMPYVLLSLIVWECEHLTSVDMMVRKRQLLEMCVNSLLHISVNSDQFSQCAEQIRYLFTSNVGLGASSDAICNKIDFIRVKSLWEILYISRMLKMSAGLNIVFKTGHMRQIIENNEFKVMFPNNVIPVKSFSYTISCMYYANLYNKFRAFHEVSEAICYNELVEENNIYMQRLYDNKKEVDGITPESLRTLTDDVYIDFELMKTREVEFCKLLISTGPDRFKMSLLFIIGATTRHLSMNDGNIKDIYKSLSSSPIEACSMHGAMESGKATKEHQGIRAASAMFEELVDETGNNVQIINKNAFMGTKLIHDLSNKSFDFSILSGVARQFVFKDFYRYRIVQKDQKGHREISVLNSKFRLGALLCEKIAHTIADTIPEDLLDNPNKDTIIENKVRSLMNDKNSEFVLSDNSDQKRWGPNHLLHSFSAMFYVILQRDLGLFRVVNLSLMYGENKYAKLPESLIDLGYKTSFKSKSEPISKFFNDHAVNMNKEIYESKFEWGMCQGIYHRVSSLYHGLMCKVVSDVCMRIPDFPKHELHSFVTSDDAERMFNIKESVPDRILLCKNIHSTIINVGCVMNILRNESKSVFSSHITEFNSIFYHKGVLATPTLKQRISKLDIGEGHDPHLDYLTAISMSMGYFQNGGSYMGAVAIMFLNTVLHTEQWNRWHVIKDGLFNRPVEFGGFPVLEPFTAMYCGPISSMFLKSTKYADAGVFSHLISSSILVPAVPVNMDDFIRSDSKEKEKSEAVVYKSAGPLGIISKYRTDKRLSKFEKRHHMSKWNIPDKCVTLIKTDNDASRFLFNLIKITLSCEYETNLGVNSFHIRFTDPWVNKDRVCLQLHDNSLFTKFLFPNRISNSISPYEFSMKLNTLTDTDIESFYSKAKYDALVNEYPNKIGARIEILMSDAYKVYDSITDIYDPVCVPVRNKNFIVKVNLQKDVMIDEDYFYLSLLKSVIGTPVKPAIERFVGSEDIWDKLDVIPGLESKSAAEGMFHCGNIIELYNRFIKKSTKLICPGDSIPDNLPDLFTRILKCKFTEVYGLKYARMPELRAGNLPHAAYRKCNDDMIQESVAFWINHEKYIDRTVDRAPNRVNIISGVDTITNFDSFALTMEPATKKTVEIKARGKFNFINRLKMWLAANVNIRLHDTTLTSLLNNDLTYLHEYALTSNTYIKNQTNLQLDVEYSNQSLFEIQYCNVLPNRNHYIHHFFTNKLTSYITPFAKHKLDEAHRKPWANRLVNFINRTRNFNVEQEYNIVDRRSNEITDTIVFHCLSSQDDWELITLDNNLTIFLKHLATDVLFPICGQQLTRLENYNLNINYKPADLINGMEIFAEIDSRIYDQTNLEEKDKKVIQMLLFRSCYSTSPMFLNELLTKADYTSSFISEESVDFCRSLILSNLVKNIKGNRIRIQHFFLNLFRSSPYYNNGMTSVEFDESFLKDEELELEVNAGEDDDVLDLNIPDIPAWFGNDAQYNDILSSGLEDKSKSKDDIPESSHVREETDAPMEVDVPVIENITSESLIGTISDIFSGGFGDDDDDLFAEMPEEGFEEDYAEISAVESSRDVVHNVTKQVMNIPVHTDIGKKLDEPMVEGSTTHVINKHFEECHGIVASLLKIGSENKALKKLPRSFTGNLNTISGTLVNLSNKAADAPDRTVDFLNTMYKNDIKLLNLKVPMSAICIAELHFT